MYSYFSFIQQYIFVLLWRW